MIVSDNTQAVIYSGKGAFGSSVPKMEKFIRDHLPWTISCVTEENFRPRDWDPRRTVCIFPGGMASEMERAIGDRAEDLQGFFAKGGRGLFFCGSSFAASTNRTYNGCKKTGKLNLLQGSAIGPLFPDPEVTWQNRAVELAWEKDQTHGYAMSIGGGYYLPENPEDVNVLARYKDGNIAVLTHRYGEGLIAHSMVHFIEDGAGLLSFTDEEDRQYLNKRHPSLETCKRKLSTDFPTECLKDVLLTLNYLCSQCVSGDPVW